MSFLKITDPSKREFIVNEFLKSKRNIQQSYQEEKLGDIGIQRELKKLYKPITDSQAGIASELTSLKEATTTALGAIPTTLQAITFPQYKSIEAFQEPEKTSSILQLGDVATKYLKEYASSKKNVDTTFGLQVKDGQFYIGTSPVTIQDDDVIVGDKTYAGTPGLWELLTMAKPDKSIYNPEDLRNYSSILHETDAIRNPNNPNKPRSSRSTKYTEIIKPIWESRPYVGPTAQLSPPTRRGEGIVILPGDPNAMIARLPLLVAGSKAGNTGAANEAVAICDELLRMGILDRNTYKAIIIQLSHT
jgi:hypothetical protein